MRNTTGPIPIVAEPGSLLLEPTGAHIKTTTHNQMPTAAIAPPKAPSEARVPSEAVAFGKAQWTRKWKVFASQWTQPQLMKLAKETLGEAAIHSSQIHGFTTGKLRDPAPKVLLAIGQLNLAIWPRLTKVLCVKTCLPSTPGALVCRLSCGRTSIGCRTWRATPWALSRFSR